MPPYNSNLFDPPAPVASVTLRNPDTGVEHADVLMLIDTGADITLIPNSTIGPLDIMPLPHRQYELIGFDGNISLSPAVQLELLFGHRKFRGIFLLTDQSWGIIGRNILNSLAITLDGPNREWHY